jgi:ArsR family transcriptional regulator
MKNFVAAMHALADGTRWRIVQLLLGEAMCVCELADILRMPQSSVSSHVQVIKRGGLLDSEKCEKWIYYRVARNRRNLILSLGHLFAVSPATDAVLKADARNALKRLTEREKSCCPLPKQLAARKNAAAPKRPSKTPASLHSV